MLAVEESRGKPPFRRRHLNNSCRSVTQSIDNALGNVNESVINAEPDAYKLNCNNVCNHLSVRIAANDVELKDCDEGVGNLALARCK